MVNSEASYESGDFINDNTYLNVFLPVKNIFFFIYQYLSNLLIDNIHLKTFVTDLVKVFS